MKFGYFLKTMSHSRNPGMFGNVLRLHQVHHLILVLQAEVAELVELLVRPALHQEAQVVLVDRLDRIAQTGFS